MSDQVEIIGACAAGTSEGGVAGCSLEPANADEQEEGEKSEEAKWESGKNNDNDHSLGKRRASGGQENNEWRLMQIVESAESKLMRQRAKQAARVERFEQASSPERQQRFRQARRKASTLLLKSAAFSTITHDDDHDHEPREGADEFGFGREGGAEEGCLSKQMDESGAERRKAAATLAPKIREARADCRRKPAEESSSGCEAANMTNRRSPRGGCNHEAATVGSAVAESNDKQGGGCWGALDCRQQQQQQSATADWVAEWRPPARMAAQSARQELPETEEEEERGGPTPTNDLVRALIQRDRLAMSAPLHKQQQSAPSLQAAAFGRRLAGEATEMDRVEPLGQLTSAHNDETGRLCCESRGSSLAKGASCSSRASQEARLVRSERASTGGQSSSGAANDEEEPPKVEQRPSARPKQQQQQQRGAFDLSTLIGKCQRQLHLQPAADGVEPATNHDAANSALLSPHKGGSAGATIQETLKSLLAPVARAYHAQQQRPCSPRKPSDPTPLRREEGEQLGARRHSTYLLPEILTRANQERELWRRHDDGDDDDSDDDVGELDGADKELPESSSESSLALSAASEERYSSARNLERHQWADLGQPLERGAPLEKRPWAANLRLGFELSKLRQSASSPSALSSTPTNLEEGGGCGAACCSREAQLVKLAHENAASNTEQKVDRKSCPKTAGFVRPTLFPEVGADKNRKLSLAEALVWREQEPWESKRPTKQQHSTRCSQQQQQLDSKMTSSSTPHKRHSIINLWASSGQRHCSGGHLVNRLSHPRLFFHPKADTHKRRASTTAAMGMASAATNQEQYDPLIPESGFKIVLMGSKGSGKTSIIQRFLYDCFDEHQKPTVGDNYFVEFPHQKKTININISDTSGTYQFPAMKKLAINSGDAFILVYSVDSKQSFEELRELRKTILDERDRACSEVSSNRVSSDACPLGTASCSTSSGLGSSHTSVLSNVSSQSGHALVQQQHQQQQPAINSHLHQSELSTSSSRHWSLASLFNSSAGSACHQASHHAHGLPQLHQHPHSNTTSMANQAQSHNCQHRHSTAASSLTNSSNCSSICSSTESSRRSSISAVEAALRTRRTRFPPMVVVANKHDLPAEQHVVNSDEIEAVVVIDWNDGFVRASAAQNYNIDEIFKQVLTQARQPPTLTQAIVSKRRKSLPPKLLH